MIKYKMPFKVVLLAISVSLFLTACTEEAKTDRLKESPKALGSEGNPPIFSSKPTPTPIPEVKPQLGKSYKEFEIIFGKYTNKYMYSYSFKDGTSINTEDGIVKEISQTYANENFIDEQEAFEKIKVFLPSDAKEITEKIEGRSIYKAYKSDSIGEIFSDFYKLEESRVDKGIFVIRVGGGVEGSKERNQGVTRARMTIESDVYLLKDLGLKK